MSKYRNAKTESTRRIAGLVFRALACAVVGGWLVGPFATSLPIADASGIWQETGTDDPNPVGEQQDEAQQGEESSGEQQAEGDPSGDEHADAAHTDDEHGAQSNFDYYLDQKHLIAHTADHYYFEIPSVKLHVEDPARKIHIPWISPWTEAQPLMKAPTGEAAKFLGPITFQPTKFVVLELLAALFVFVVFVWLARKIQSGKSPTGRLWNMLESVVVYVRDEMAKPAIGAHDYKTFLPLIWTTFFFILTMNLMGMFPLLGTPTGNINVTTALALCVFLIVLVTGMKKLGVIGFWKAQAPHVDLPPMVRIPVTIGLWCIEVFGLFIKHMVLSVRLFANMFAGHMVLAVIVGFIGAFWGTAMNWLVIPGSIGGSVAIGLLEVLVAFIQAYVFTFLAALFIGTAIHPH